MKAKLRIYPIIKTILNPLLNDETKFFLKTWYYGQKKRKLFKDLKTYCMFIGSGRSGHSLIASLIDSHPNAIISNELNVLKYFIKGFGKNQLFSMILENSRRQSEKGRSWTGYSYSVENQTQGSFTKLLVIGDKKGGISTELLEKNSGLLREIIKRWNLELKLIHVIRNPYDVISTMARGGQLKNKSVDLATLEENIDRFFQRMQTVEMLKTQFDKKILDVKHEDFIKQPKKNLREIVVFLGLLANEQYLNDCSLVVNKAPSLSRNMIDWPRNSIEKVKEEFKKYSFLQQYTFEEV